MDSTEFRKRGKEMVDFIADYMDTIESRRVIPDVKPGFLRKQLPEEAPTKPESWNDIFEDFKNKIMPGVNHFHHPHFFAYYANQISYPSLLGEMASLSLGNLVLSWATSPAGTELETTVVDWLGKMIGLPEEFLFSGKNSKGGGVIQGSSTESNFMSLVSARSNKLRELKKLFPLMEESVLLSKMRAYSSKDAHCSIAQAAMMALVKLRLLETDEDQILRGPTLLQALKEDISAGLFPFYVVNTLGTTSCCAFDDLSEIGPICDEYGVWLHVDAAYAGNSFICPELRGPLKGIENASSFNVSLSKFMLINFDSGVMWVKDRVLFTENLMVHPAYLQHSHPNDFIDYRHWGVRQCRRFLGLKVWFVLRTMGVVGLQEHVRRQCRLARGFEARVRTDDRFQVASPPHLGLVCFRLKGPNHLSERLLSSLNASGKIHMMPTEIGANQYVIRFCVCAPSTCEAHIDFAWKLITKVASTIQVQDDVIDGKKCKEICQNGNIYIWNNGSVGGEK